MDSAKEIAKDMLNSINVDGSGFWGAVGKGFISLSASLYNLGRDYMDTEHRYDNFDDKIRMAQLIKSGTINREVITKVISEFISQFMSRVDMDRTVNGLKKITGNTAGKIAFAHVTGVSLGQAITNSAVGAFFSGTAVTGILFVGAEVSRAIYTSRYLKERNFELYRKLRDMGDLDLLYYLVEDVVKPFEKACVIHDQRPDEFNKICDYFFGGL